MLATSKWFKASDGCLHNTEMPNWASIPLRKNYSFTHSAINSVQDLKATIRNGEFAWPGGYQMAFVADDGDLICFDCARSEFANIADSMKRGCFDGWRIVACTIVYDGEADEYCAHCYKQLASESE